MTLNYQGSFSLGVTMSGLADAALNVVTLGGYGQMQDAKKAARRQEAETKRLLTQNAQEAKPPIEKFRRRQAVGVGQGSTPAALLQPAAGNTPLLGQ